MNASCLTALVLFGLVSILANSGGCGREPRSVETPVERNERNLEGRGREITSVKIAESPTDLVSPPDDQNRLPPHSQPGPKPLTASAALAAAAALASEPASQTQHTQGDPFQIDSKAAHNALFPTPSRKWTSTDGRTVLGTITAFDPATGIASMRTASGETFDNLSAERLSELDREYLYSAAEGKLPGRVVGVTDGDTLTLLVAGNTQFKIRLESIDAPEIGQEYGNNSKAELGRLVQGKDVEVRVSGTDKYKRTLGWIVGPEGENVNLALVAAGLAWNYVEYSKNRDLAKAEIDARAAKRGLWKDWKPMAPWDWRDLQRENAARRAAQTSTTSTTPTPFMGTGSKGSIGETPALQKPVAGSFWLNTSSGKRHNQSCRYYGGTKNGRACGPNDGSACGICGG